MPAWLREFQKRRTRRRQLREIEQCLAVLRPALREMNSVPARSMADILRKAEAAATIRTAEQLLVHLRELV